jgi:Fur family ferric uptake transcriptional regulator
MENHVNVKTEDSVTYHRNEMQKEIIIEKLRRQGCRITKQRRILLDIILQEDCSCCKEIYYKASKQDSNIGFATIYRMVNVLEEIGAISRKNMYKVACGAVCNEENVCTIEWEDDTVLELSAQKWNQVIQTGLHACGYGNDKRIRSVLAKSCVHEKR